MRQNHGGMEDDARRDAWAGNSREESHAADRVAVVVVEVVAGLDCKGADRAFEGEDESPASQKKDAHPLHWLHVLAPRHLKLVLAPVSEEKQGAKVVKPQNEASLSLSLSLFLFLFFVGVCPSLASLCLGLCFPCFYSVCCRCCYS